MIRLLGDRVLVLLPPSVVQQDPATGYSYRTPDTAEGSIILAQPTAHWDELHHTRGIVVQLGEKRNTCDLDEVRSEVWTWLTDYDKWSHDEKERGGNGDVEPLFARDQINSVLMKMQPAPFDVQVGDFVVFPPHAGELLELDGHAYVILTEADILGVVEPEPAKDAAVVELTPCAVAGDVLEVDGTRYAIVNESEPERTA